MGRIAAPVEGQVPKPTQSHDWTDDTLARMLGLLDGMAEAGILHVPSDASMTRVVGETLRSMVVLNSQTPRTQPATAIGPCLDSMEFLGIVSHLAKRPSMTIDEQKMFESFKPVILQLILVT